MESISVQIDGVRRFPWSGCVSENPVSFIWKEIGSSSVSVSEMNLRIGDAQPPKSEVVADCLEFHLEGRVHLIATSTGSGSMTVRPFSRCLSMLPTWNETVDGCPRSTIGPEKVYL